MGPATRICVIVPCFNDGALLRAALGSLDEPEPLELVVVDDASTDAETRRVLDELEAGGTRVVRHEANRHLSAARMSGLAATRAPYVFPLDADDEAVPGVLSAAADRLDADPGLAAIIGDVEEFGAWELLRAVPDRLDPYRIAHCNEYPTSALFRRSTLEHVGGWRTEMRGYEDWDLWMTLAEADLPVAHIGAGRAIHRYRREDGRMLGAVRERHVALYLQMRRAHPRLFADLPRHRRASPMPWRRKLLYPVVYGGRRRTRIELRVKRWLDDRRLWTLRR